MEKGLTEIENTRFRENNRTKATYKCNVCSSEYVVRIDVAVKQNSCGCLGKGKHKIKKEPSLMVIYSRIYKIYHKMKERCYNPKSNRYEYYGGKGINICEAWLKDFENFLNWALSNGYCDNLSIDRKNVNLGYFPENCRWATDAQQAQNTSKSIGWQNVNNLREEYKNGISSSMLAIKYKISLSSLSKILNNHSYYDEKYKKKDQL